jgi:hypothetical protein
VCQRLCDARRSNCYKADKNYKSDFDGCLTDEQGTKRHGMHLNDDFYEHFELIESKKQHRYDDN